MERKKYIYNNLNEINISMKKSGFFLFLLANCEEKKK